MNTSRRAASSPLTLITVPVVLLAAATWLALSTLSQLDDGVNAPIGAVSAPPAAKGGWIDHSVVNDPDRLPEPNPAPLAVAAYDA